MRTLRTLAAPVLAAALWTGCAKQQHEPSGGLQVDAVTANLGTQVDRVVVTVAGTSDAGTAVYEVETLESTMDAWQGHFSAVLVGSYSVEAEAYAGKTLLFHGTESVKITRGTTAVVRMTLQQVPPPVDYHNWAPIIRALVASSSAADVGAAISFRAVAVDPEGQKLTYAWTADCGTFTDARAEKTDFSSVCEGTRSVTISVTDAAGATSAVTTKIQVGAQFARGGASVYVKFNSWPDIWDIRLPSSDAQLRPGEQAQVAVEASDADGDALQYLWTLDKACLGKLDGADTATPTFVAPQLAKGETIRSCTLTVEVTDGRGGRNVGWLTVNVMEDPVFLAPVIEYAYQTALRAFRDDTIRFRVYASNPQPGPLAYAWSAGAGSTAETAIAGGSELAWTPDCTLGERDEQVSVSVQSSEAGTGFVFPVRVCVVAQATLGFYEQIGNGLNMGTGFTVGRLFAMPADVSLPMVLQDLGFMALSWSGVTHGDVHMGLYSDGPGGPAALLGETSLEPFAIGRNTYPIASQVHLAPGKYWIAFAFQNTGTSYAWVMGDQTAPYSIGYAVDGVVDPSAPLPATFPAHSTVQWYPNTIYGAGYRTSE